MNPSETNPGSTPSESTALSADAGEGPAEIGRETVRLAGTGSIKFGRNPIMRQIPTMRNSPVRPPHTRSIPGCACPECGRAAEIHGGIASDYLYQVVLAEIGTRGVEVVCEGCRHRYIFGAAVETSGGDDSAVEPD